jgi:hypothetical protein
VKLALILALLPAWVAAQNPHQAEIDRALIERDRQSAEFSRPELRDLHTQQDHRNLPPRPDERGQQARERDAYPRPSPVTPPAASPGALPLPGGARHGVDPIPVQGAGH